MTVVEEKTLSLLAAASGVCDKDTEMEYSQLGGVVLFARNHTVDALVADAVVEGRVRFVGDCIIAGNPAKVIRMLPKRKE